MANRSKHAATVNGKFIPYGVNERPDRGKWEILFRGPGGNRIRKLTTADVTGKLPPDDLHAEATRIIGEAYNPQQQLTFDFQPPATPKTWDELLDEVEKGIANIRPETVRSFRSAAKAVKETLPEVESPLSMTDERIRRFMRLWLAKKGPRGPRKPVSLSYYVRALSAFTNHLVTLEYITRNVWHGHRAPTGETNKKDAPTDDQTERFFAWVESRYPTWKSLHALLTLKSISASRTADVCQIKTEQLQDGKLTFTAATVKTKNSRALPLPDDLFATLKETVGPVYLWENLQQEITTFRKASNGVSKAFNWKTVYYVLNNLFREYSEAHPKEPRFTPHGLRRRAITLTVRATGSVDAAATAIGVHPQTARQHYLDSQKAFETDETMKKVADILRPKFKSPENKPQAD